MKTLALFILVAVGMSSCTSGPIIRETGTRDAATGAIVGSTTIFMGGTLAAKRKGVVTQAKKTGKGGWNISYMVDSESSEAVPMALAAAWGMAAASADNAAIEGSKQATARHTSTQATIQHGKTVDGQVALGTEAIKAGNPVTVAPLKAP